MKNVRKQTVIITRQWTEGLFSVPRRARHKNAGHHSHIQHLLHTHRASRKAKEGRSQTLCVQNGAERGPRE